MSVRVSAYAGVLVGVGWLCAAGPAAAGAVPQPSPVILSFVAFNCPGPGGAFGGVEYVRDPDDSNAFYVCSGGLPQQRLRCPNDTVLNMNTTPPTCDQWRAPYGN